MSSTNPTLPPLAQPWWGPVWQCRLEIPPFPPPSIPPMLKFPSTTSQQTELQMHCRLLSAPEILVPEPELRQLIPL